MMAPVPSLSREEVDARLLEQYRTLVRRVQSRLGLPESEALDVAHDVVAAVYDSLDSFDPQKGPFDAWVSGILRNHLLRALEGRGRRTIPPKPEPVTSVDPLERLVIDEVRSYLGSVLERQPPLYRDTLRLRYVEGKELREVARTLGVPVGTVKARLSRAPALLREGLQIQQTTLRLFLNRPES